MRLNNRKMQAMLFILICMIVYTGWYTSTRDNDDYYTGIIRFHVIANSDSTEDQELKLKVRDGVLEAVNEELVKETMAQYDADAVECSVEQVSLNIDESREYLQNHLDLIEDIAEDIIKQNGYSYTASAELGVRWIPTKTYGDTTFPAGNYEALNITIGEGEGQNWWCVLYPPLCLIDSKEQGTQVNTSEPGITAELVKLRDSNKNEIPTGVAIKLKFKTLEVIQGKK
ncbi:stage II sporulation protein R [Clostridium aminobutyricum]|uniref:Stage II sporulation protein R n=1 Tax=Clostridium aminobutyricum TaxID=33953 RepID=A0A939DAH5_CLOAM|nr:stage II sporulation protein R [Clostridium aminobutyricum]MBN7774120.1 stage II sporulation protein R [Clostridium aminobutyricum]